MIWPRVRLESSRVPIIIPREQRRHFNFETTSTSSAEESEQVQVVSVNETMTMIKVDGDDDAREGKAGGGSSGGGRHPGVVFVLSNKSENLEIASSASVYRDVNCWFVVPEDEMLQYHTDHPTFIIVGQPKEIGCRCDPDEVKADCIACARELALRVATQLTGHWHENRRLSVQLDVSSGRCPLRPPSVLDPTRISPLWSHTAVTCLLFFILRPLYIYPNASFIRLVIPLHLLCPGSHSCLQTMGERRRVRGSVNPCGEDTRRAYQSPHRRAPQAAAV